MKHGRKEERKEGGRITFTVLARRGTQINNLPPHSIRSSLLSTFPGVLQQPLLVLLVYNSEQTPNHKDRDTPYDKPLL